MVVIEVNGVEKYENIHHSYLCLDASTGNCLIHVYVHIDVSNLIHNYGKYI